MRPGPTSNLEARVRIRRACKSRRPALDAGRQVASSTPRAVWIWGGSIVGIRARRRAGTRVPPEKGIDKGLWPRG